jgi:hypothetical protein
MTYGNLEELVDAYKAGELTSDDVLFLDNDTADVYVGEDDDARRVFTLHPAIILEQALDLLGVPHEGV